MRPTVALYWRHLLRAVHPPPLETNAAKTQRILGLLQRSIRDQVDQQSDPASSTATEKHLDEVLRHPVFSSEIKPSNHRTLSQASTDTISRVVPQLEKAILEGQASPPIIRGMLLDILKRPRIGSDSTLYLKNSPLGGLLRSWLFQNGMERDLGFLSDHSLTSAIIQILVASGQHEIVMTWLESSDDTLFKACNKRDPQWTRSWLLYQYIKAEASLGEGVEAALDTFLNCMSHFSSSSVGNDKEQSDAQQARITFGLAGNYLMGHLHSAVKAGKLDVSHYDRLTVSAISWTKKLSLERGWLALHHPEQPDALPAYAYLRHILKLAASKDGLKLPPHRETAAAHLALDAAEAFASTGETKKAIWLMSTLETHFAGAIGIEMPQARREKTALKSLFDSAASESDNVRQLETLALG